MFEMKSTALYFAEQILCDSEQSCVVKVQNFNHPDFVYIQSDETTIKKQQIEELLRKMNQNLSKANIKFTLLKLLIN